MNLEVDGIIARTFGAPIGRQNQFGRTEWARQSQVAPLVVSAFEQEFTELKLPGVVGQNFYRDSPPIRVLGSSAVSKG